MTTNPIDPEGLILFLDIDGVLHPEGVGEDLHFDYFREHWQY